jgi:small basic protein
MGEVMWIEVLGRGREVVSRHRVESGRLAIGRAYDNDVIIDDPAVAPHHLALAQDESGAWAVEDLGSLNGLWLEGASRQSSRVVLKGGEVVRIGRSLLRFRPTTFPVPPEHPLTMSFLNWTGVGTLAPIAVVCVLMKVWLAQTVQPEFSHYVLPLGIVAALLVAWTGLWALMSRVFAGHAWVERHFFVALCALIVDLAIDAVWGFTVFAFALPLGLRWESVFGWFFIAGVVYAHLRIIGPGQQRTKAAVVVVLAFAAIGLQEFGLAQMERVLGRKETSATLLPPALRVVPGSDDDAVFAGTAGLKARLDRARHEELPAALLPAMDTAE